MEAFLTVLSLVISDYQCQLDLIVDIPYINLLVNEGNPTFFLKQKHTSKFFAHESKQCAFFFVYANE